MTRVLIADDEPMNRKLLKEIIGIEIPNCVVVHAAEDGLDAFEAIQKGVEFDVLITDLMMPRMRGDELIKHLRNAGKTQPMFVLTGDHRTGSIPGATAIIKKPYTLNELFAALAPYTGSPVS